MNNSNTNPAPSTTNKSGSKLNPAPKDPQVDLTQNDLLHKGFDGKDILMKQNLPIGTIGYLGYMHTGKEGKALHFYGMFVPNDKEEDANNIMYRFARGLPTHKYRSIIVNGPLTQTRKESEAQVANLTLMVKINPDVTKVAFKNQVKALEEGTMKLEDLEAKHLYQQSDGTPIEGTDGCALYRNIFFAKKGREDEIVREDNRTTLVE